jgi:Ethanolamine utilization protein EutJ (predicted chaperonin)
MVNPKRTSYVAECFWAGVLDDDLHELDRRIEASVAAVAGDERVRCLGWLHVIDDEVVLVLFEGPIGVVRRVAEHAEIPFGRILQVGYATWPPDTPADVEELE